MRRWALLSVFLGVAVVGGGCTHAVVVDSNVEDAVVRVDGETIGTVKDGASFVERGGFSTEYDVDVTASGYVTERRRLRPSLKDSGVGVPATVAIFLGAGGAGCVAPTSLLVGVVLAEDEDKDLANIGAWGYGIAAGSFVVSAVTLFTAAWGVQQLPDVVTIDLDPEDGGLGGAMAN